MWAHRILRRLGSFHSDIEKLEIEQQVRQIVRQEDTLIGVYENVNTKDSQYIVIGLLGLYILFERQWRFIKYSDIKSLEVPGQKTAATGLLLTLLSGEEVWLSIDGGNERFRDVFEFLRFLNRVSSLVSS